MPASRVSRRNFRQYDKDNAQAGLIAPTHRVSNNAATAIVASRAYVARFVPSRPMRIISIAFSVSTAAGSDDACDVGIFNAALTTLLTSAGATTGKLNGLGVSNVTFTPVNLAANTVYYAAFSCGTIATTAASLTMSTYTVNNMADLFGNTAGIREQSSQATAHPLTAPFTLGAALVSVPYLALREA